VPSIAYIYFVICTHFFQTCSICNPSSLEGTRIKHWTDWISGCSILKSAIKKVFPEPVGKAVVHYYHLGWRLAQPAFSFRLSMPKFNSMLLNVVSCSFCKST
jgi:hypothetical protein